MPLLAQLGDIGEEDDAVEHGDAEQGDKPDRSRDGQIKPGDEKGQDTPPIRAKGRLTRTSRARRSESNVKKSRKKMSPIVTGKNDRQPAHGPLLVLELAAPGQENSRAAASPPAGSGRGLRPRIPPGRGR